MSFDRAKITSYADQFWCTPCADNVVYTKGQGVNVALEISKRKLSPQEWQGMFLRYWDNDRTLKEGLYLVRGVDVNNARKNGIDDLHIAPEDKLMLVSYFDDDRKNHIDEKPPYHGLNDCSHFVTECLAAGGVDVRTTYVPSLLSKLTSRRDTRTLGFMVPYENAAYIIESGIMQPGDVIIYSSAKTHEHNHSVVYMGDQKVSMHTVSNHPNDTRQKGVWIGSRDERHDRYTFIHFTWGDQYGVVGDMIGGWWQLDRPAGKEFLYIFDDGRVGRSKTSSQSELSPSSAIEMGYWYYIDHSLQMVFKSGLTAEFKNFSIFGISPRNGRINGIETIVLTP